MPNPNQSKWNQLWARLGAKTNPAEIFQALVDGYEEPPRAYHNLDHIADCLNEFEAVRHLAKHEDAIELALWFHDVIYDSRAKDNEEKSADMAEEVIKSARLSDALAAEVRDLILATKHNALPKNDDAGLMLDIDLSILGQLSEKFDRYEKAIRSEYDWVPEEAFANGRSAILESFLKRQEIYSTDFFRNKYEARARENLARSIAFLQNGKQRL